MALKTLFSLAAWPLALGALGAAALSQGGRFSARLDILTHLAPVYLAAGVLALALALIGTWPRPGVLTLAAALAVVASGSLMAEELFLRPGRRAAEGAAGQIKVIQFNAWGGNRRSDEAVEWLLRQDADIIVAEEAGKIRDRLVRRGGYAISCPSCGAIVFTRRKPIRRYRAPLIKGRPGYLSSSTLADERGEFVIVGVHRHWPTRFALDKAQRAQLEAYLAPLPKDRLILAGDFNSTPWSFARRRDDRVFGLIRRTRNLPTWPAERVSHNRLPAPFPFFPIDHVYAGPGWATVKVERGPRLGSDHYPVIVTLAPAEAVAK